MDACRQGQGGMLTLVDGMAFDGTGIHMTRDIDLMAVGVFALVEIDEAGGWLRDFMDSVYVKEEKVIAQATLVVQHARWHGKRWKSVVADDSVLDKGEGGFQPGEHNMEADAGSFMQTNVDKFGGLLQKLLSLLEKLEGPVASMRANFLASLLADVKRPGPRINAAIIERMDRLQALLLAFEGPSEMEMTDNDRD